MTDLFHSAAEWRARQSRAHASEVLRYERPGVGSWDVPLTRARGQHEVVGDDGVVEMIDRYDFLASPEDLLLAAEPVEPRDGDLIVEVTAAERITYRVSGETGQPCWRWCDAHRQKLRIHTKIFARQGLES